MGRWLNELKNLENAKESNPQNPQNPPDYGRELEKNRESASDSTAKTPKTPPGLADDDAPAKLAFASLAVETLAPPREDATANLATASPLVAAPDPAPRRSHAEKPAPAILGNVIRGPWERQPGDMEAYADALRRHGPMSYGMAMGIIGWGGTRAGQAEQDLLAAGRIRFNAAGRAVLVEEARHDDQH